MGTVTTYFAGENDLFLKAVEQSRGGLRRLVAELTPAAAATDRFNKQQQLLDNALSRGRLTLEQHAVLLQRLTKRHSEAAASGGQLVNSAGSQRAGFQQLSFQIGDIATQYGSGTKAMTIFAQQSGQVIQALGMMTTSTKGLLGFLGGPWGQIITAATVILAPFIAKLFESADGADAATDSVLKYADALQKLQDQAGAFKFGSAEFRKVNTEYLTSEAKVARLRAELANGPINAPMVMTPGATGPMRAERTLANVREDLAAAVKERDKLASNMKGLILQSNNNSDLNRSGPPEKNPKGRRPKRGPKDRSDQRLERFDDQFAQLQQQQLGLMEAITTDVRDQAGYQHQRVDAALEAYKTDLDHQVKQKEITAEKAKELLTVRERNAELEHTKINWALDDKLTQQELALTQSRLENAEELNRGELDAARTQADRRRIQLDILENERALQQAALEAVIAKHDSTDVEKDIARAKLAQLDKETGQRAGAIRRDTMGPLESYLDKLPKTAAEINEAFQHVAADGIQSMTDGLAEAIAGSRSLADVFHNVANQIIADLIRIELQKAIAGGLSKALGSLTGSTGGSTGITTSHAGAGNVKSFASGGSMRIGGVPGVDRNVLSINGIPRAMVSHNENFSVGYGQQSNAARIEIVEHPGFASRVVGISGDVSIKTTRASNNAAFRRGRARLA